MEEVTDRRDLAFEELPWVLHRDETLGAEGGRRPWRRCHHLPLKQDGPTRTEGRL